MTADDDRTVIRPLGQTPATLPEVDSANGLPLGTRLGEFELTAVVGEGGFGIVYLALDHSLGRKVALKEYMPSVLAARVNNTQVQVKSERHRETFEAGRKSFINEAQLLAQFDHPSLVKVYRFWEANGTAYMVMPFYEGKTLKDTLRAMDGPPNEAWLRALLQPLTEALEVLHDDQCYHRDIAPDNVMMLAGSQRPLLLDFGAARRVIGDMTQALTVILKPGFAPVEQYAEIPGMKQGPWTDVYALAAVVHQAIMGRTPPPSVGRLVGDSYVPLVRSAAGRYSTTFLAAIDHALAVRPDDRTSSVAQLRAEMGLAATATTAAGSGSAAAPSRAAATATVSAADPPAPAAKRSKAALLGAGGLAAVLLLGVAGYVLLGRPTAPAAPAPSTPSPSAAVPVPAPPLPAPDPTVAAAPAAPAPAPVALPRDTGAVFERILQAQSPNFLVEAVPNKTALRIDRDELSFTITSQREGYLTVQLYSSDGELLLLYPNTQAGQLKVRPGQAVKLPRKPMVLLTVGPPGPNLLLVMVSEHARDFSALQPRDEGTYRVLPAGEKAQRLVAMLPASRVPAQAGVPRCPAGTSCDDVYGAAIMRVDAVQ